MRPVKVAARRPGGSADKVDPVVESLRAALAGAGLPKETLDALLAGPAAVLGGQHERGRAAEAWETSVAAIPSATHAFAKALAQLPPGALARGIDALVPPGPCAAAHALATRIERVATQAAGIERDAKVGIAAALLRASAMAERVHLEQLAVDIPPEARPQIAAAVSAFYHGVSELLVHPGASEGSGPSARVGVTTLGAELQQSVAQSEVQLSPAARTALDELTQDAVVVAQFAGALAQLADVLRREGVAATNKGPTALAGAVADVSHALFFAGVDYAKFAQKNGTLIAAWVDQVEGALTATGQKTPEAATMMQIVRGISAHLQEDCPPMSDEDFTAQLRKTYGERRLTADDVHGEGEPVFLELNRTPRKSGTCGQIHQAKALIDGRVRDIGIKVLRVGLKGQFEAGVRRWSFLQRLAEEWLRDGADPAIKPMVAILYTAAEKSKGYVAEMKVEAVPPQEIANMQVASAVAARHEGAYVPEVFPSLSGETVIAQEWIYGLTLSDQIDRLHVATRAARAPWRGQVDSVADAERRAQQWAAETYGQAPQGAPKISPSTSGYDFELKFDSPVYPAARGHIAENGQVSSAAPRPTLTKRHLRETVAKLFAEFLTQFVRGEVHGDAHGKNYFATAGGGTAWFDWGLSIRLTWRDLYTPAKMLAGLALNNTRWAADALVSLSNRAHLHGEERNALVTSLATQLTELNRTDASASASAVASASASAVASAAPALAASGNALLANAGRAWDGLMAIAGTWRRCNRALSKCGLTLGDGRDAKIWGTLSAMFSTLVQTLPASWDSPKQLFGWMLDVGKTVATNLREDVMGAVGARDDLGTVLRDKRQRLIDLGVLGDVSPEEYRASQPPTSAPVPRANPDGALTAGSLAA